MSEAYICDAIRTLIGRFGGALSSVRADDLAALPIKALMARNPRADWQAVDDVIVGCANQAGEDNRIIPAWRFCWRGCRRTFQVRPSTACAGPIWTRWVRLRRLAVRATIGWRFINPAMKAAYDIDSMPETAENVAREWRVSCQAQDKFALRSQQKVDAAQANGRLASEIVPVTVKGKNGDMVVSADEHPRADTTLEALARLKPVVRADGTVTAGNASGVNDGAAALLIASEAMAKIHGLTPRARILAMAPRIMGVGPVSVAQKLLVLGGITMNQIDVIELNEAFASQSIAVLRRLSLSDDHGSVNRNSGAVALCCSRRTHYAHRRGGGAPHRQPLRDGLHVPRRRPGYRAAAGACVTRDRAFQNYQEDIA